jgi:hypothetical protein
MGVITGEIAGQTTGEVAGEATVWLSYHDLADRLGIKPASAKRRAVDRKWPKKIGNDGRSLVAVPREIIEEAAREITGEVSGEDTGDIPSDGGALVDHLKGELEETRRELRTVRAEAAEARDRAVKAEAEAELQGLAVADLREELQARTAELEARRTETMEARERAARAEGELAGLQSRGLWARLWLIRGRG